MQVYNWAVVALKLSKKFKSNRKLYDTSGLSKNFPAEEHEKNKEENKVSEQTFQIKTIKEKKKKKNVKWNMRQIQNKTANEIWRFA